MRWIRLTVLIATVGLFGFLSGVVWMKPVREAQRKPRVQDSVVAREFKLVDSEGRVRAELGIPFGEPVLFLYDRAGKPRAWLTLDSQGNPRLMFVDKNDAPLWQAPPAEAKASP